MSIDYNASPNVVLKSHCLRNPKSVIVATLNEAGQLEVSITDWPDMGALLCAERLIRIKTQEIWDKKFGKA